MSAFETGVSGACGFVGVAICLQDMIRRLLSQLDEFDDRSNGRCAARWLLL
jgi:hypothetical protein